jgi:hypothetical protein
MTFDEDLQRTIDALSVRLREQLEGEVRARIEAVRAEADEAARQKIEEVRASAAAEARARAEEEARAQVQDAQARADAARAQLDDLRAQLEQARAQAKEARTEVDAARAIAAEELQAQLEEVRARAADDLRARVEEVRLTAERDADTRVDQARAQARKEADARLEEARVRTERETSARLDEVERQTRARIDEAVAEARRDADARVQDARAESARQADARIERARAEAVEAAKARAEAETRAAAQLNSSDGRQRVADAIGAIDRSHSLSQVLDSLVDQTMREAARAALLIVRGGRLYGWRFAGFGAELEPADQCHIAIGDGGLLADAVRRSATAEPGPYGQPAAPPFAGVSGTDQCLAVPLTLSGEVVAVLYADSGPSGADSGRALARPTIEVLALHAARCLEAITAFKAARVIASRGIGESSSPAPRRDSDEEESARRYARLLVSEIRLYHEAEVAEGRERRDLGTRLASEIARARVLYEQRVPPDVRRRADYFHAELVRTLADGDARLLEATGS